MKRARKIQVNITIVLDTRTKYNLKKLSYNWSYYFVVPYSHEKNQVCRNEGTKFYKIKLCVTRYTEGFNV